MVEKAEQIEVSSNTIQSAMKSRFENALFKNGIQYRIGGDCIDEDIGVMREALLVKDGLVPDE